MDDWYAVHEQQGYVIRGPHEAPPPPQEQAAAQWVAAERLDRLENPRLPTPGPGTALEPTEVYDAEFEEIGAAPAEFTDPDPTGPIAVQQSGPQFPAQQFPAQQFPAQQFPVEQFPVEAPAEPPFPVEQSFPAFPAETPAPAPQAAPDGDYGYDYVDGTIQAAPPDTWFPPYR